MGFCVHTQVGAIPQIDMSPKAGFVLVNEVVPRLRSAIPRAVSFVGAEDAEELVQDATCMAARLMQQVEQAGKEVTAGNIAHYTLLHVKAGRRFHKTCKLDVMGAGTQIAGRSRVESLEQVVASDAETGGEIFLLHDVLSRDEEDPSTRAARKMDWDEFIAGLPERERVAVMFVARGGTLREAGRSLGLADSTMQSSKRSLGENILAFMGPDILKEVRRQPQWRSCLEATRERQACRHERQAA